MKKIVLFLTTLVASIQLNALYQGNPSNPEIIDKGFVFANDSFMGVKIGYQRDQIFDRKLSPKGGIKGEISEVQQIYDQGVLILDFMDRVEIFGSAGAMSIYINDQQTVAGTAYQLEYQTHNDFTWGIGTRVDIVSWCNTTLGATVNFQDAIPSMRWNSINGAPFASTGKIRWKEWQVGVGLSHHIDVFTPYIGVNYSQVHSKIHGITRPVPHYPRSFRMHSRERWGLAIGCDLSTGKIFDIGVEARMISEQAVTFKADIKF